MTRRLYVRGPDLRLNVQAPHGRVRAQVCEVDGTPIPGLTLEECVPFTGDDLFHRPRWRSGLDIVAAAGRHVHVEFEIAHGRLYAIRGDLELH